MYAVGRFIFCSEVLCNRVSHDFTDSVAASQLQCPWFEPEVRLQSVWSFPSVSPGFLQVSYFPPTFPKHGNRWINEDKLALGVSNSVNVCAWCPCD